MNTTVPHPSEKNKRRRAAAADNPCRAAALDYLARGWSALALCPPDHAGVPSGHAVTCKRPGKAPLRTWKDYQARLPTEEELRDHFGRCPSANVGVALGPVSELLGLDIDGEAGEALLAEMSQGILPPTLEFTTGQGRRLLYAWPQGVEVKNEEYKFGAAGEVRVLGKGRQTVMPPSVHPNETTYTWKAGCGPGKLEPAACPNWLLYLLAPGGDGQLGGATGSVDSSGYGLEERLSRARLYLEKSDEAISGQGGHNQTLKVCDKVVVGLAVPVEEALALLAEVYNPRCAPPWEEKELRRKCEEAIKTTRKPMGYLLSEPRRNDAPNGPADRAQATTASPADAPWEKPLPLDGNVAVPPFPVEHLPPWLRAWVVAEADATQTPPDLAALLALAVAGAALAKKFRVTVRGGWHEHVNILVAVALPSGERKSAVHRDVLRPVYSHEQELRKRAAPDITKKAAERRLAAKRLDAAEKQAAKAKDPGQQAALDDRARRLAEDLDRIVVPERPQVVCDDETPENLAKIIARNGGRMLQTSAEGTALEIAKGRYSQKENFDVYLKGHANEPIRVGRVGRDADEVDEPALTAALAVQPDVICGLAERPTMRSRGFLARWFYALPQSRVGRRQTAPPAVPALIADAYERNMLALWCLEGDTDEKGRPASHCLYFSSEADLLMQSFQNWLEPQLAEGEKLSWLAGWASKLAGGVARLAGILHMAGAVARGGSRDPVIDAATVEAAVALGRDYLLPHAQAAFGLMGADRRALIARRVLRWLTNSVNTVKFVTGNRSLVLRQRDIHTGIGGNDCNRDELKAALGLLVEHHYLRPAPVPEKKGPGHPGGLCYAVNPLLYGDESGDPVTEFTKSRKGATT